MSELPTRFLVIQLPDGGGTDDDRHATAESLRGAVTIARRLTIEHGGTWDIYQLVGQCRVRETEITAREAEQAEDEQP